jgi:hypothetical protein
VANKVANKATDQAAGDAPTSPHIIGVAPAVAQPRTAG